MSEVRVAVVDSCPILREGLRLVLGSLDVEVVGTAENVEDALRLCLAHRPDVVLLGPSIPVVPLLGSLRILHEQIPDARSIVFRVSEAADFAVRCMEAGASGYLSSVRSSDELATAVKTVAAGQGRFFSPAIVEQFTARALGEAQLPHSRLSAREFEVFVLLGAGLTVGQVATHLDISPKTVSTHRTRIREKTGLSSTAEIVRYVLENSLV